MQSIVKSHGCSCYQNASQNEWINCVTNNENLKIYPTNHTVLSTVADEPTIAYICIEKNSFCLAIATNVTFNRRTF